MVRGAAGAAAANVLKKYRRMKIDMEVGGGSCLFEKLRFMKMRARGVKGIRRGHALIELNPEDYETIRMEDKVNEALFKKLEDLDVGKPGWLQTSITVLSKLMIITSVPLQVGGVAGGIIQRANVYRRQEALQKTIINLQKEAECHESEHLKVFVGTLQKTADWFTGKISLQKRALKVMLESQLGVMDSKIDRIRKLVGVGGSN